MPCPHHGGRDPLRLKPVTVSAKMQRPELLARLAQQIALADQDLVAVPTKRLALGAVAPADHRTAAGHRTERQVLEPQDLFDDRFLGSINVERISTTSFVVERSAGRPRFAVEPGPRASESLGPPPIRRIATTNGPKASPRTRRVDGPPGRRVGRAISRPYRAGRTRTRRAASPARTAARRPGGGR